MINADQDFAQDLEPFEDRIDFLAKELELAIMWQRPSILLVVYRSEYVRADAVAALESKLTDLGQEVLHFRLKNTEESDLISLLSRVVNPDTTVFFVDGLRWGAGRDGQNPYTALNIQRDFFVENRIRIVFWLTENEAVDLAHYAPDYWAFRSRVIEFVDSPKPEQIINLTLELAWQGTGEYTDASEDTDAKISLRESLLTDLPEGKESTAMRANLLLSLGILHWRKGDCGKAAELLQDAREIAAQIQDKWFEAQCFNAIALVETDQGKIDEAIAAYKQAIRLAPDQIFPWNNLGNLYTRLDCNDEAIAAFQKAIHHNPADAISWNGLGNVYLKLGCMDDATAAYRKAIEINPDFAHPWNGLGEVYLAAGQLEEAVDAFEKAVELNDRFISPWLHLGNLFETQKRHENALKALKRANEIDPVNAHVWNDLGIVYYSISAYEEAVRAFNQAIELEPGFGWPYSNLALVYTQQGKYIEAISLYQRSIELLSVNKDKAIAWNRLGNAHRCMNDYEKAIAAYKKADALDPSSLAPRDDQALQFRSPTRLGPFVRDKLPVVKTLYKREDEVAARQATGRGASIPGEPRLKAEQVSAVLDDLPADNTSFWNDASETQIEIDSDNAHVWNELGNIQFNSGAYDEAISAYTKAIELDAGFGWAYSNLALTYAHQARYMEAVSMYQKSIELLSSNRDKAIAWNGLGNAYRRSNDYANAAAAYQKADELDPDGGSLRNATGEVRPEIAPRNAHIWNELGNLYFNAGAHDEAINAYTKAIQLDTEFGWPYSNLALAYTHKGSYADAVLLYQRSIELFSRDKDRAVSWNRLGNVYRRLNDYDNAIAAYQKAVELDPENSDLLTRARFSLLSNCNVDR